MLCRTSISSRPIPLPTTKTNKAPHSACQETREKRSMPLLQIKNLHVETDGKPILKGLDLAVNAGEVHAIMGPNGSGKSTLAYVLAGKDGYEPTQGEGGFDGKNMLDMEP